MQFERNSFHKAAEALEQSAKRSRIASFVRDTIINAHKFVVPDAGKMTDGKRFDHFGVDQWRLPFPRIALQREIDDGDGGVVQQIVVAVENAAFDRPANPDDDTSTFWVADCVNIRALGPDVWAPSRPIGCRLLVDGGIELLEIEGLIQEERALTGYATRSGSDASNFGPLNGLGELLLMLSLANVGTRVIHGPKFLNRKRAKAGKLPLYDYHVLVVDNQEVYSRSEGPESDRRIRSHFRRGHIRRLDETRRVWVRASYVHGRADGFVDKDYLVKAAVW